MGGGKFLIFCSSNIAIWIFPISSRVNKASIKKTEDTGSIPDRVKINTKKSIFTPFLPNIQLYKWQCEASTVLGGQVAAWLKHRKVASLSPCIRNLMNKDDADVTKNTIYPSRAIKPIAADSPNNKSRPIDQDLSEVVVYVRICYERLTQKIPI